MLARSMWAKWERFWFITGPPHALAVFRIGTGFFWLAVFVPLTPHVELCFSNKGLHQPKFRYTGEPVQDFNTIIAWLTQPAPPNAAWIAFAITLTAIVFFTAGIVTRLAMLVFLVCVTYYWFLYWHTTNSAYHHIAYVLTWILLISPCDRVFSVRRSSWFSDPHDSINPVPLWTQRLMCVHVAWVYFGTGVYKIGSSVWDDGTALKNFFMGYWASDFGFWIARLNLPDGVYDVAAVLVILFELTIGYALFQRNLQPLYFVLGLGFHLGIALTLDLWLFMIMPLSYILFVDPTRSGQFLQAMGNRFLSVRKRVRAG